MNRLALYARVSSEIQEKEATIESQVALLREAAAKQGDIVVQEYRDDGFSGDLLARPGLDRLRDDAARGLFDSVLILSPDRLARKWIYGEVVSDDLKRHGIQIQFLNQRNDGTEESKLLLGITGLFGQYEKAKMIERIRRGRMHCAKSGRVMTSHPPYGYDYIRKSPAAPGRLEINPDQARVVRLIFELYARAKLMVTDVARELRERMILTPTGGRDWARSTIKKILTSSTYIGTWHYNKTMSAAPLKIRRPLAVRRRVNTTQHKRPRDQWVAVYGIPAIIDQETFDLAQRQLARNRGFSKRNRHRPYLLAGLTRCGSCSRAVCGSPNNGYIYYRCTGNFGFAGQPGRCAQGGMNATKVDLVVWGQLSWALRSPDVLAQYITGVRQGLCQDPQEGARDRENATQALDRLKAAESRLLDAYSGGAMDVEQLKVQMQAIREKREAAAARLEQTLTTPAVPSIAIASLEALCSKLSDGLDYLDQDFEERQKFVRRYVDKVVLTRNSAVVTGSLPLSVSMPQELFRTLGDGSLQQRGRNHIIQFELAVAI
jgi:site-specific DNA recombinase